MELIVLLIRLLAKAFDSGNAKSPGVSSEAARQMDLARQIQQRIEEARLRAAREQRGQDQPMMARLPPPVQRPSIRLPTQQKQTGRQPTAKRSDGARVVAAKRKSKRVAPPPLPNRLTPTAPAMAPPFAAQSPDTAVAVVRRPTVASADANLLARWLRPQTLRAQFILTEVFQPPLSLRQSHLF